MKYLSSFKCHILLHCKNKYKKNWFLLLHYPLASVNKLSKFTKEIGYYTYLGTSCCSVKLEALLGNPIFMTHSFFIHDSLVMVIVFTVHCDLFSEKMRWIFPLALEKTISPTIVISFLLFMVIHLPPYTKKRVNRLIGTATNNVDTFILL